MTLDNMKEDFERGKINKFPTESLAALCCVLEDNEEEHEVVFTVPVKWLINELDKEDGRRCWDENKLWSWLEEEYTSEDSEMIWQAATEENQIVTFNINY